MFFCEGWLDGQRPREAAAAATMSRSLRSVRLAAIATVVVLSLATLIARYAGEFLVRRDALTRADVAIVLSGEPSTRTLAARDLYRERRIRRIVIIPEAQRDAAVQRELDALRIATPPSLVPRILLASGVPSSAFVVLPDAAEGTIEEARRVEAYLRDERSRRIVVITSKFASRRACFIFSRVLKGREILCWPTPYDSFEPRTWWRHPRDAMQITMEYQKLVANALMLIVAMPR